ncbi:protein toll-like [Littorina saxatilis]|uniref:TIR domain-containing protein n=1 Tax=Littorina saxatilis TaxID=31220 RepID=A0AAN9B0U8_9CAEN
MLPKTTVVLALVVLTSLLISNVVGDDDTCLICTCGSSSCSGENCCQPFDISALIQLTVSVQCSTPAEPHIIAPLSALNRSSTSCGGYHLFHPNSCLTAMPESYCLYNETRAISLANNYISEFPHLVCLPLLGMLDLSYNDLKTIPEDAFDEVPHLRHIFLDHNEISHIHPKAFDLHLPNLQVLSLTYNQLTVVEGSVVAVSHPFCLFNFSHNLITTLSNTNSFQVDPALEYGPGYVDFSYNRVTEGPMVAVRALGISKAYLAKFLLWAFDVRHNPFHCDCNMYEVAFFLKLLITSSSWREFYDIACVTPARFSGVPVYNLTLDQLTCNVSKGCPHRCSCENNPEKQTTFVDCKAVGLTSFPRVMPKGLRINLNMANNSLQKMPRRKYLSRAATIDLRGNGLTEIEGGVPHLLRDADLVDLRDNDLRHLPETFRALRPEAVYLDLHTWRCSCHLQWVGGWLRFSDDHSHLDNLTCTTGQGRRVLLASATKEDLGCYQHTPDLSSYKTALVIGSVSLLGVAALLVVFRYEILVLCQHLAARRKTRTPVGTCRYQVFVSVNADSAEDCGWVRDVLLPALDHLGLSSFLPPRDCLVGSVEMDEVTKHLHQSAAALVVVSPDYVDSGPCLFQFSQAYSHMVANRHGPLLVVQLSPVSRRAAREPRLRAMLTLRLFRSADPQRLHAALTTLLTTSSQVKTPQAATVAEPNFDTW